MKHFLNLKFYLLLLMIYLVIGSCNTPNNETTIATINYDYSGCFASGKSKLVIYKVDTITMARLENNGQLALKSKLNLLQLDTFHLFVNELKQLDQSGLCTTVSNYSVALQNETISKTDNSCDWNGFDKLRECLFKNSFSSVLPQ